jgi:FAD binding domain
MTDIQIATTDGTSKILEEATIRAFRAGFRGSLLSPGDGAYDETRKVWNGMIDRHPALIARCAGVADVVAAVSFARAHGLLVSVRGGGHNTPGVAVCEGGLMIRFGRHEKRPRRSSPADSASGRWHHVG